MAFSNHRFKYDLFLSFRGQDTRHGLTPNLWKALHDRGIKTFIDDEEFRIGQEITPSLIKAIQDSNMAIIVLSKNYASSSVCLQVLSTILDSIGDKGRLVWPVFYQVDPSDVRRLRGSYREAMAKHEIESNTNVEKWKTALQVVAALSGFHFKKGVDYEHVFIEKIVEKVSREIIPLTLHVPDYLVGLKYQKKNFRYRFKYDVFLSFRGQDTRLGFTGNLWKALQERGIKTFMDDKELRKGQEITPSLIKTIQDSNMAITVLSENYATSSFCLQELSTILDSIKDMGRLVWPVFYEVDPSDVRWLRGSYGKSMAKHEMRSNRNVEKWKTALEVVAGLSGFHFKKRVDYEHVFIEKIVEKVSREIIPLTLPVPDYLVGLKYQKENVISLLSLLSDDAVHMVGIHGIGGIGKTTLALEVYNSIAHQFQGSCYLEKVRENSDKNGLIYLQKILLSQIVGENNIEITSVGQGISILRKRLPQKKILLLLDDVDKEEQLSALTINGSSNWFGLGSRVIITTRDKRLLTCHGVENEYEVKGLNDKDAFDLVSWKAFKNEVSLSYKEVSSVPKYGRKLDVNDMPREKAFMTDKVFSGYVDVLKRAVKYASGLPLALEVIGSHFSKKSIEQCHSALDRYARIPDKKIQSILQLSFDALQTEEKSVFLDIACCFNGYKLTRVEQILNAHYDNIMKHHISVLVEKSLIKISVSGYVTLHDLLKDMGKEIVRQESPKDPGKRSRLWASKDIIQVLEENTGTSKIETICPDSRIEVEWDGEAFKKMENLRTLIILDGQFSVSPKHLPNSLRILEHCLYPSWDLPSEVYPKKLTIYNPLNLHRPSGGTFSRRISRI